MVFEVVGALVIWLTIAIGVRVYMRYFARAQRNDPGFEAWCARRPRLAYFAVRPDALHLVRRALLEALGEAGAVVVSGGGKPWPIYALELGIERVAPDVIALVVESAKLRRGRRSAPELFLLIERAVATAPHAITELWLHGQLHQRKAAPTKKGASKLDRDRIGWLGRPDAEGLHLEVTIGVPGWALATPRAA